MCSGVKQVRRAVQGHKSWVLCLAWSPDGLMVATGGMEGALWLWDPKTGNPVGCCKGAVHDATPPSARVLHHLSSCMLLFLKALVQTGHGPSEM